MKPSILPKLCKITSPFSIAMVCFLGVLCAAEAESSPPNTVVFSETSPDYQRKMLPSGRFEPETYAFSMGNLIDSSEEDESLTKLSFHQISGTLAEALKAADYVPTQNVEETKLLIVVSWGKTTPRDSGMGEHAADSLSTQLSTLAEFDNAGGGMEGSEQSLPVLESEYESELEMMMSLQEMSQIARQNASSYNATLLGYDYALKKANEMSNSFAAVFSERETLLTELESPRYFVVLQVYDFQKLWKEKERELLWTSRFSIRAKNRNFDEELMAMAMASCREFGKASKNLRRNLTPSRVEFGELEYLGVESDDHKSE